MLINNLNQQIIDAMKAGDSVRVSTLKLLSSEIHNYKIDHPNMTADEELSIIKKEAKKRKDAIEAYTKAGLKEKVIEEQKELEVLQEFLPAEMTDTELEKIIDEVIKENNIKEAKDFGKAIGFVMQKVKGQADGSRVSQIIKSKLG